MDYDRFLPLLSRLVSSVLLSKAEATKAISSGLSDGRGGSGGGVGSDIGSAAVTGGHTLLAALLASDRYLLALVNGTGRLWAACEAVRGISLRQ